MLRFTHLTVFVVFVVGCGPATEVVEEIPGLLEGKGEGEGSETTTSLPAILTGSLGDALEGFPEINPKKLLPASQTTAEKNAAPAPGRPWGYDPRDNHAAYSYSATPYSAGTIPGEFAPVKALLIGYPSAGVDWTIKPFFAELIAAVAPHVKTIVYTDSNYTASSLYNAIDDVGGDPDDVTFTGLSLDSIWMRDYGPLTAQGSTDRFLDFRYYYGRWEDDRAPTQLASKWGVGVSRPPLDIEGGNFQSDGAGSCITTTWTVEQNQFRDYGSADVREVLKDYAGCTKTLILPTMAGEGTGHVDMYATITGEKQVLVGEYKTTDDPINAPILDTAAQMLENAGFTVTRIPMPDNWDGAFRSYTNSLAVGSLVLVPVYTDDDRYESKALDIFRQAYPGRTIIPIDSTTIIQWAGAVHCVTMTLPE